MKRIIIIGGGPGGYVAAIRAAQMGAEVHLVEEENLGGTCLNVGCIPTKALLHTADLYQAILQGGSIGLKAENIQLDWQTLQKKKQAVVTRLVKGVEGLLKANKVTVHKGHAVVVDAHTVDIEGKHLAADSIVLALGSESVKLGFPGADLPGVLNSTGALGLAEPPASMIIIGGGVIGVEFAGLFSALGCKVTVVEMLPRILPVMDKEIAGALKQELSKNGVAFLNEARVTEVRRGEGEGLTAKILSGVKEQEITAQYVLVAVGRRPRIQACGLEEAGIRIERGRIIVNEHFVTSVPGIYAIGDCIGQVMLAHAASAQGIAAVEHAMGHQPAYYPGTIPSCIYTKPEAASVGLTEEQLKEQGIEYKVGRFQLAGNGKTLIENGGRGMVKILSGAKYGEILGVHILGPRATDMIAEAALGIRLEATLDEIISTIHAHPTVSEALGEAALDAGDKAIHWPPKI